MKVKIVDKKEAVMTIEELARQSFIGVVINGDGVVINGETKDIVAHTNDGFVIISGRLDYCCYRGCSHRALQSLLVSAQVEHGTNITFHVFNTAKELFVWMAE